MTGTLSRPRTKMTAYIKSLGGTVTSTVTKKTMFLLSDRSDYLGMTSKVRHGIFALGAHAALTRGVFRPLMIPCLAPQIATAKGRDIPIVSEDFLDAAVKAGDWEKVGVNRVRTTAWSLPDLTPPHCR